MNGSTIATYGTKEVHIPLDKKTFKHTMTIGNISSAILGWDFLVAHKIDLLWTNNQCVLFCGKTRSKYPLHLGKAPADILNLEPMNLSTLGAVKCGPADVSYKEWAQSHKSPPKSNEIPQAYRSLLAKYPGVLECKFLDNPKHNIIHEIDTADHRPCRAKPRPIMPGTLKATVGKDRWLELEQKGVTEKIKPDEPITWSSALHLVPKDGTDIRVCSDFRPLNNLTVLDHYPLPALRSFTNKLLGARVFSKLDLKAAYFQIPLSRSSSFKTTTLSPWGTYRYKRLAMGLRNAPQSFQKLMDYVLSGLDDYFVYMDDIMVYSKNENSHLKTIEDLFHRLTKMPLPSTPQNVNLEPPA